MANEKRKWVFIRGLGRHTIHWGPFIPEFKKMFPGDEIEQLDLRGNGLLVHSPSCLSIKDNVRDLRARSKFIQQGQSIYLMTISLSSMVGTEWATLYPEEVEGLVIMNTSDRGTSSFFQRMRPQNYIKVLNFISKHTNPFLEQEILDITTNHLDDKAEWAKDFAKIEPTTRMNLVRQLLAAGTYEFPKHKPRTEVLLLSGAQDQLVNPTCTDRIGEMWTLKPHINPTAGHDIPLEDPKWVCDQVQKWLESY